jgi:hypothetical protein
MGRRTAMRRFGRRDEATWIEAGGRVVRLLPDDREEVRHQRFVVRTATGQNLLVAHNLEVSERVPLGMADRVGFRGLYAWNDLGGTVHWTHHDPRGEEEGGWIEFRRRRYD